MSGNQSEVVRAAIRLLDEHETEQATKLEALRRDVANAAEQVLISEFSLFNRGGGQNSRGNSRIHLSMKPQKPARKHHYVPAFLLARWSSDGTRDGEMWRFILDKELPLKTTPNDCAFENYFNTVRAPDLEPNLVEDFYAELESHAKQLTERILSSLCMPLGQDRSDFLYFVAHQITRVHFGRETVDSLGTQMMQMMIDFTLAHPQYWEHLGGAQEDARPEANMTYERFRYLMGQKYKLRVHPNWQITHSIQMANAVFDRLALRNWSLVISQPDQAKFIISDNPVVRYKIASCQPLYEDQFGPDFNIFFPLSPNIAILSDATWGEGARVLIDLTEVGRLNAETINESRRECYSANPDVQLCFRWEDRLKNWKDFVQFRCARK